MMRLACTRKSHRTTTEYSGRDAHNQTNGWWLATQESHTREPHKRAPGPHKQTNVRSTGAELPSS
eukprot:4836376-Prymnesium_polylepis.1